MIEMDGFDRLPDHVIMHIFNNVADIKTLTRCRCVSKRFNSLVPRTESLHLNVDCVISSDYDSNSVLLTLLKSLLKSLNHFLFNTSDPTRTLNSLSRVLSGFHRIRHLQIELPAGDLKLGKDVVIKWRAEFGKTLKSCVVFGFRTAVEANAEGDGVESDCEGVMKTRVLWTIKALIAASARQCLLREVVTDHEEMERLVLKDRDGEGTVVMEREGLRECRLALMAAGAEESRAVLPSVTMRMRLQEGRMRLSNGKWVEGATLVTVRPCSCDDGGGGADVEGAELALEAFGSGVYGEAVKILLNSKGYSLEMNTL